MQRRRFALAALGLGLAFSSAAAAAQWLATPRQSRGPFYPDRLPLDQDNDLTRVPQLAGSADGEITELSGRLLDLDGSPIAGAQVEIWQCDAKGRYIHSDDPGKADRDPRFQGYGRTFTAADGGYRFRTIKPVPYPGRAPHIHMAVAAPGRRTLVTQLYVEGAPENDWDWLRGRLSEAERKALTVPFRRAASASERLTAHFDVVLR